MALAAAAEGRTVRELLTETEVLVHGSTVATNAVLEGKGARTGVIVTRGTRYTLWRGEGRRSGRTDADDRRAVGWSGKSCAWQVSGARA